MKLARGFTLLEVLVAVSITAIIGVSATQLLSSIIQSKESTLMRSEQLAVIQRFNNIISRDVEQFISRSIRDEYDGQQNDITLGSGDFYLQFSRLGWRNSPIAENPRSHIQRVAYNLEPLDSEPCKRARALLERWQEKNPADNCLIRYYWDVLDRSESEPKAQMLLPSIDDFEAKLFVDSDDKKQAVDTSGWVSDWPSTGSQISQYPVALRVTLSLPALGEVTRIWSLAHSREVKASP